MNKPTIVGNELEFIQKAIAMGKLSGNGYYTHLVQSYFKEYTRADSCLFTNSCTDALEMAALLLDIKEGDEVIVPSYTFPSSALVFASRGATVKFADTHSEYPNVSVNSIKRLITNKTKAIVLVHYGGVACDMDEICDFAKQNNIHIIEDAAHAIDSYYKGRALGSIGTFGTFSFHDTKNITCGEGGLLSINDPSFTKRAEIIWEKGTNKVAFQKNEIPNYDWVDLGSSFLGSEISAAFLYAQILELKKIQKRRSILWNNYQTAFYAINKIKRKLGIIPSYGKANGHIYFICCFSKKEKNNLIEFAKEKNIILSSHYHPLHQSPYFKKYNEVPSLIHTEKFADCLLRLPLYYSLENDEQERVIETVINFYHIHE